MMKEVRRAIEDRVPGGYDYPMFWPGGGLHFANPAYSAILLATGPDTLAGLTMEQVEIYNHLDCGAAARALKASGLGEVEFHTRKLVVAQANVQSLGLEATIHLIDVEGNEIELAQL
jgi:hypothetical protein